ncbi:hypothetical protein ABZY02_29465 [Streptomyces sp. NPDC006649]
MLGLQSFPGQVPGRGIDRGRALRACLLFVAMALAVVTGSVVALPG